MLLVIGDSHSVIWGGRLVLRDADKASRFPRVKVHHIGAALAYNLMGPDGNPGKWGAEVLALVRGAEPATAAIMLCFGEIDVRTQLVKQAVANGLTLRQSAERVADRYLAFVDILRRQTALPIFLFGAIASANDFGHWDTGYPNCGSELERNAAARAFNDRLAAGCGIREGVVCFDILGQMLTPAMQTKVHLLDDGVHIGWQGLEFAIAAFRRAAAEKRLALPDFFDLSAPTADRAAALRNISKSVRIVRMSSNFESATPRGISQADAGGRYIFHTNQDDQPFVLLDLGFGAPVQEIRIFNRLDGYQGRAATLEILVGNDLKAMHVAYAHSGTRFEQLGIAVGHLPPFRHMMCRLRAKEFFHLGGIEIFAQSFL